MLLVDLVTTESTSLARVAYEDRHAKLKVEFRDGTAYQYEGVPLQTFVGLFRANSKGAYFNNHIRGRFPHSVCNMASEDS